MLLRYDVSSKLISDRISNVSLDSITSRCSVVSSRGGKQDPTGSGGNRALPLIIDRVVYILGDPGADSGAEDENQNGLEKIRRIIRSSTTDKY